MRMFSGSRVAGAFGVIGVFFVAAVLGFAAMERPVRADAGDAYVKVELKVDLQAGMATGQARYPDGDVEAILIQRKPLAETANPFEGYIGPTGALLPADAGWLPLPADVVAAGWDVTIEAPKGFLAAPYPDGEAADGVTRFRLAAGIARAPLVVGPFKMAERVLGDIKVRTFFTDANRRLEGAYLEAAGAAIKALAAEIGPYPYGAFAVVESPLPVGLGYPGYTLVSGRILPYPFMRGRSLWHEISHVWFGNGVFVDYAKGNWAEGFAAYFADYGLARQAGPEAAKQMRYDWLLEYDVVPPAEDIPLRAFVSKSHGQSQAIGYGKAAMTLHMLRLEIGDAAFKAGIRRFWQDNQFTVADWGDIQAAFEAESGLDLSAAFARWIDGAGALRPNPEDTAFNTFRKLAPEERIETLRAALAGGAIDIRLLSGAPGPSSALSTALQPVGQASAKGAPLYVGDVDALLAVFDRLPPEPTAGAIFAGTDKSGAVALGLIAPDIATASTLASRLRHYLRWSWVVVEPGGRPRRGRWTPG